jgi:hypothetical protein
LTFQFLYENEWPDEEELRKKLTRKILDALCPEIPIEERSIEESEVDSELPEPSDSVSESSEASADDENIPTELLFLHYNIQNICND